MTETRLRRFWWRRLAEFSADPTICWFLLGASSQAEACCSAMQKPIVNGNWTIRPQTDLRLVNSPKLWRKIWSRLYTGLIALSMISGRKHYLYTVNIR